MMERTESGSSERVANPSFAGSAMDVDLERDFGRALAADEITASEAITLVEQRMQAEITALRTELGVKPTEPGIVEAKIIAVVSRLCEAPP